MKVLMLNLSKKSRILKMAFIISILSITLTLDNVNKEEEDNKSNLSLNREHRLSLDKDKIYEVNVYYKKFNILLTDLKNIKYIVISDKEIDDNKCHTKAKICIETSDLATNLFQNSCVEKLYINVILIEKIIENKPENVIGSMNVSIVTSNESCIVENSNDFDMCLTKNIDNCKCSDSCEVLSCGNFSNNKFVS